jgi:hypothetical protein
LKILFIFLVFVHGLIHLFGFIKAYNIVELNQLSRNISKPLGLLWLLSFQLLLSVAIFIFLNIRWWWLPAIIAMVVSQILLLFSWQDAKYGTIPNLIILMAIILGIANWNFNNQTNKIISSMLSKQDISEKTVITDQMIEILPFNVEKWLKKIG